MNAIKRIIFRLMEVVYKRKRTVLALSCLVVFITTYVLILPAFTLEKDEAARQGGINVPSVETTAGSGLEDGDASEAASDEADMTAADGDIQNAGDAYSSGETLADDEADIEDDEADMSAADGDTENPEDAEAQDENSDDADTDAAATVDFHYEVNGQKYDYSFGGGETDSLRNIIDKLHIYETVDKDVADDLGAEQTAEMFLQDVEKVEFSDEDLVKVARITEDTTAGELNKSLDIEPEYSAELTEEDIKELESRALTAPDWALISLKPFDTEETLTVTMKNGDVFEIRVTDKHISTNVLTADGSTYKITVTFDDDAEIPGGTNLEAREIEFGTDEYNQLLGRTWSELNKANSDAHNNENKSDESTEEPHTTNVDTARYFELTLVNSGNEIEISDPVSVDIQYDNGPVLSEEIKPGIICFRSDETELIDETVSNLDGEKTLEFAFETTSLPTVGTYIAQETHSIETKPGKSNAFSIENRISGMPSVPALLRDAGATESDYTNDDSGLEHPVGNKSLEPNNDGTYTMSLSVKGHSNTSAEVKNKANILFVMDRSSSMITNKIDDNDAFWYYGVWGTDYTFRGDIKPKSGYQFWGVINGEYVELICNYEWNELGRYGNYQLTYWNGYQSVPYPTGGDLYVASKTTRLVGEQTVLNGLVESLLDQNTADISDNCEVAIISFGDHRFDTKSWSSDTEEGWTGGNDTSGLESAINSPRYTSGTNWEEALQYAYQMISAKKAQDGNDEDYYVVFLTDGEPTNVEGDTTAAAHSGEGPNGNIYAYDHAKDEARKMVQEGYQFYNIFTYRKEEKDIYSIYLTNFAYTGVNYDGNANSEACQNYYTDARTTQDLIDALSTIFERIENFIGHGNVSITDTLTTDAMTTTVVHGKANGYTYTVTEPNPDDPDHPNTLYTVTATGNLSNPTVTFHVPGSTTENYPATASTVEDKTVYSVTTDEGKVYKMALADVNDETGELVWDLSPVGILMDDCTYSVNFIVWPDQEAYDYVAALNNGLESIEDPDGDPVTVEWDDSKAHDSGNGYLVGGVEHYPSIVKYPNGTYAVLTNTDQKIHYSVVETESVNGVAGEPQYTGPFYQDLQTPPPMPLTASKSQLEKVWNVEKNPEILAQLLYGSEDHYNVTFDILQDDDPDTDADDNNNKYTAVTLGWDEDANDGNGAYVWDPESVIEDVPYNGETYSIGTRWVDEFSIATGLALSTDRMDALGLDKSSYKAAEYNGTTYYILEDGHDYTIKELNPRYEFDFKSPIYHPMLVDGVLMSVNVTKNDQGEINGITKMEPISVDEDGTSSLKVENNLRGYLHLNKVIVDQDGETPLPDDNTKFEFTITLTDSKGRFTGHDIPWYGINGLFYHDEDFNYYQAQPTTSGHLSLKTEFDLDGDGENDVYDATCSGTFDPDIIGPTTVTYIDAKGKEITIRLSGNQMEVDAGDPTSASATMEISQNEVLNMANIPEGTTYTIVETEATGYDFVKIDWEIKDGDKVEDPTDETHRPTVTGKRIEGTIIPSRDNHVTYTNKCLVADISIRKLDGEGTGLPGAIFRLVSVDGLVETPAAELEDAEIQGIGTVVKTVNAVTGETKSYYSSFETTGEVQTLSGLPNGTYRLYEDYVPAGYIKTVGYIQFTVEDRVIKDVTTDTGDTTMLDFTSASGNTLALLKITNIPGAELPHTGGIGTKIFYILGSMLAIGCAAMLIARRRMGHDAE